MVSRTKMIAIVIAAGLSFSAGVAIWIVTRPDGWSDAPADSAGTLSEEQRRERTRDFFSAPKEYDTKSGQEMRPRW
ncbi:MAG: entry exclusion protein TrbK [Stutzerimonas stutzeri]|nr:MAG: entry exclusion protein TrbK [Stutzerimonas stutzeri]